PPGRQDPLGREQILGAPGNAVQRSTIAPRLDLLVGLRSLRQRELLGERDHAIERGSVLLQARQIHLRELGRRDLAPADERRQRRHRQEREILGRVAPWSRRRSRYLDFAVRCRSWPWLPAREVRAERQGRLGLEGNLALAQTLEGGRGGVAAWEGPLLFCVGELDPHDPLGTLERCLVDALRFLRLPREDGSGDAGGHSGRYGLQKSGAGDSRRPVRTLLHRSS